MTGGRTDGPTGDGTGDLGEPVDSAGVPWTGRELPRQPFAGDDGTADPALAAALAAHAAGAAPLADVVTALGAARVLVAVVAVVGTDHPLPTHDRGDLGADLAVVTLTGADGVRALPVFTGMAALTRWDAAARPVPVESARAALSAVAEGCDRLRIDPAGPVPLTVPRPAVWALGRGLPWTPPAADAELLAAVADAVRTVPDVLRLRAEPVGDAGLRVVLGIAAGLSREALATVVDAVRARIAGVELLAERADAVQLAVVPA